MGYGIKRVKATPGWKVQFITYSKATATNKDAVTPRKIKDIPKSDWFNHGFTEQLTFDEAQEKAKSLNAQAEQKRWSETKVKIRERLDAEDTIESAFLPSLLVSEFESEILFEKLARGSDDVKAKNKVLSHWRAAKRIIREIAIPPKQWHDKAHKFNNLFIKKQMSPSYVQKVTKILNEWGFFVSRKEDKSFLPIPAARGASAQRIADAFFDKSPSGEGEASDPLTPAMLAKQKSNLSETNYNWLFISVWFGLRPFEIDGLKNPKNWKVTVGPKGRTQLHVYQPKLITVPRPKRWKVIPVKCPEQTTALKLIESQDFKRPIYKTMRRWFGEDVTPYGGRKGFVDLMLSKGEDFVQISMWMGHRTLDRTYRDYKNRLNTDYEDAS